MDGYCTWHGAVSAAAQRTAVQRGLTDVPASAASAGLGYHQWPLGWVCQPLNFCLLPLPPSCCLPWKRAAHTGRPRRPLAPFSSFCCPFLLPPVHESPDVLVCTRTHILLGCESLRSTSGGMHILTYTGRPCQATLSFVPWLYGVPIYGWDCSNAQSSVSGSSSEVPSRTLTRKPHLTMINLWSTTICQMAHRCHFRICGATSGQR